MLCVPTPQWIIENVTLPEPETNVPLDVFAYIFNIGQSQTTYATE